MRRERRMEEKPTSPSVKGKNDFPISNNEEGGVMKRMVFILGVLLICICHSSILAKMQYEVTNIDPNLGLSGVNLVPADFKFDSETRMVSGSLFNYGKKELCLVKKGISSLIAVYHIKDGSTSNWKLVYTKHFTSNFFCKKPTGRIKNRLSKFEIKIPKKKVSFALNEWWLIVVIVDSDNKIKELNENDNRAYLIHIDVLE